MNQETTSLAQSLANLDVGESTYAIQFVDQLLGNAVESNASDVHVQPVESGVEVRFRVDGALQLIGVFSSGESADIVARLKVMAGLLTYRADTPQEGRLPAKSAGVEMRVSTFPTLHGERAVVRLLATQQQFQRIDDLGLGEDDRDRLTDWLDSRSGAIIIAGPAGSGKTTTAYACLRELARRSDGQRCIVTLEDPIEAAIDGVVQSQVRPSAGFDLDVGLRSLVRQDPEAIMVGEIRDPFAAETVINASLTGHLVITTFHAEDGAGAMSRLLEMGVAPYLIRSGVRAVIAQRLVRRLCDCAAWSQDEAARLGLPVARWKTAAGCPTCRGAGYLGRRLLAEFFTVQNTGVREAILAQEDQRIIADAAKSAGMTPLLTLAYQAIECGETTPEEIRRVFGFFDSSDVNRDSAR
jgi:type II secretory ATPase GspE/PulE/Tfp pilus assembly ATPase PilB-like protein